MPILIDRQRAVTKTGAIRIGEQVANASGNGTHPTYLKQFRFTSANKAALEMLAKAYGGTVTPWAGHTGEWELKSKASTIKVILDTRLSADETFELYDGQTCARRCDGCTCSYIEIKREGRKIVETVEHGDVPCLCDPDELGGELDPDDRECALKTTLRVILPETADITVWQLASHGKTFNKELFGLVETMQKMGLQQTFCLLTINEIEKVVGGKKSKFAVPRLALDPNPPNFMQLLLERTPLAQAQRMLEATTTPRPSLGQGHSAPGLTAPTAPDPNGPIEGELVSDDDDVLPDVKDTRKPDEGMKLLASEFGIDGKAGDLLAAWPDLPDERTFRHQINELQPRLGPTTFNTFILTKQPKSWAEFVKGLAPDGTLL